MDRFWTLTGSTLCFLGVATGAIGAHFVKVHLTPEMFEAFKTGVLYHLIHALAIFAVSLSGVKIILKANKFFLAGILLFSFSLYSYSITGLKMLAFITPLGGVSFLAGWMYLAMLSYKHSEPNL